MTHSPSAYPVAPPHLVLGISDSHDSGAVLLRDGVLVAAINEERLSRKKMDSGFPHRSIKAVLACAGVRAGEVDAVAMAGATRLGDMPINNDFSFPDGSVSGAQTLAEALDRIPVVSSLMRLDLAIDSYRSIMPTFSRKRLSQVQQILSDHGLRADVSSAVSTHDHHACHVASAYFASGYEDCLILSNDGFGDGLSSLVSVGKGGTLTHLVRTSFFDSLGVYYNYATLLCGFPRSHHAGKTTGLAAFGDSTKTRAIFARLITWDERRERYINHGPIFRNAIARLRAELAGFSREDIAAGAQAHLEDVLVEQARYFLRKTGMTKLVLVGGVHANVKANQRIGALNGIEALSIFPNMGDGGLAAGAAWLHWAKDGIPAMPPRLPHAYLGPSIEREDALAALEQAGLTYETPADIADCIAEALQNGKVVARAAGAMEYGPRALGNRSILYAASDGAVNSWLNARLQRTEFMPFAPVCRAEDAEHNFKGMDAKIAYPLEFMTLTCDVTDACAHDYPAITHVDGTARPQIIYRDKNPDYHDILTAYARRTGKTVLVNTSYNMHEEPIVCSAEEAIRTFQASGIDMLVLGPFVIRT